MATRALIAVAALAGGAVHASQVATLSVDLLPLIQRAADNPNQFAVSVPHAVSAATAGEWTTNGATRTWTYAVRLPEAVSLSFHATTLRLPPSAILTVRSAVTTTTYRTADAGRGDFWSRIQPGDQLTMTLEVAAAESGQVVLEISSFQAGFRGLSPQVQSHSYFRRVRAQGAGDPDTACVENYACHVTPDNSPPAQATVALTIGNQFLCTGTLINNTLFDQTPYVITARHCQSGNYGGGNPGAASTVTVYWNAQTSCGTPLGTVYYAPGSARQTGATTVVEQQDAWLMQLDTSPVVTDAQFVGFDATGSAVIGGYSIHHAQAYNKQLTRWYGTALTRTLNGALGTTFVSNMLGVINEFGVGGPGASGGALFSQGDKLVGVASLGRVPNSLSGYGRCPVLPLEPASESNIESSYNAFAAVWDSTLDTTSTTGTRTLKQFLDPGNTGLLSIASMPAVRLSFTASSYAGLLDAPVTLTWNAPNVSQCTASGGAAGDGWTGALPGSGSRTVVLGFAADITYRLRCDLVGGGSIAGSVLVKWTPPMAQPILSGPTMVWTSRPVQLVWQSNVGPCVFSGGDIVSSNVATVGSITTTSAATGDVKYTLTCGSPGFAASREHTVSFVTPNVGFVVNASRRQLGQPLAIAWDSLADNCVATGGAPDDGWANTRPRQGFDTIPTLTAGTFDYGINCIADTVSVQKSVRVTVDAAAGFVTVTPERTSSTLSLTPADHIRIRYATNLASCTTSATGLTHRLTLEPGAVSLPSSYAAEGVWVVAPYEPGTLSIEAICSAAPGTTTETARTTFTLTVLPPPPPTVTISTSAASIAAGGQVTITWSSTDARNCRASDGAPAQGVPWQGDVGVSGSQVVTAAQSAIGDYAFTLTCQSIVDSLPPASARVIVTVGSPGLSLSSSASSIAPGDSFTLSWAVPLATSCSAGGGGANGTPWTGTLATTGTATQTASLAGQFVYTLTCVVNGATRQASSTITVASSVAGGAAAPSGGGASGGGGGGRLDRLELLLLAMLLLLLMQRRPHYRNWLSLLPRRL